MMRINLLPYREERRRQRKRQTYAMFGVAAAAALGVGVLVHGFNAAKLDNQHGRNTLLQQEIAQLDKQIEEIKTIKEQTKALLDRKQVVESLQANRADAVHMLDQLLRLLPDGVYLKSIKQTGDNIELSGYAQSNARVSTLMRNLDESKWLEQPNLIEIKAATIDKVRANEFNMTVKLERELVAPENDDGKTSSGGGKNT